jgi:hypothetical protein
MAELAAAGMDERHRRQLLGQYGSDALFRPGHCLGELYEGPLLESPPAQLPVQGIPGHEKTENSDGEL